MTYENKKIIVVIPAGRKRYLELLLPYLLKEKNIIDEIHLWCNTNNNEDIEYMETQVSIHPDLIKLRRIDGINSYKGENIHKFFKPYQKDNEVYIRLDDDIVYLEDGFIKSLVKFRVDNPQYFLVYGNIVNNSIIDYYYQEAGLLNISKKINYDCFDSVGCSIPEHAEEKHQHIISYIMENKINLYRLPNKVLHNFERCSVNCISWLGEEFKLFNADVFWDEEQWLSSDKPKQINKPNIIFSEGKVCVHYAFFPQRPYLDNKPYILESYQNILKRDINCNK